MLESIDDGVGMIMSKLDELGLADDTILIFSSDNGGETNVTSNALYVVARANCTRVASEFR